MSTWGIKCNMKALSMRSGVEKTIRLTERDKTGQMVLCLLFKVGLSSNPRQKRRILTYPSLLYHIVFDSQDPWFRLTLYCKLNSLLCEHLKLTVIYISAIWKFNTYHVSTTWFYVGIENCPDGWKVGNANGLQTPIKMLSSHSH